jgi:hypothetical protein
MSVSSSAYMLDSSNASLMANVSDAWEHLMS